MLLTIRELSKITKVTPTTLINKAKPLNILKKEGCRYVIFLEDAKHFLKTYYPLRYNKIMTFGTDTKEEIIMPKNKGKIVRVVGKNGKEYYYLRKVPICLNPLTYYKGSAFDTKEEAEQCRKTILRGLLSQHTEDTSTLFNEAAIDFLTNRKNVKDSTRNTDLYTFTKHIQPYFKGIHLHELNKRIFQEYIYEHYYTNLNIRLVLSKVLKYLYRTDKVLDNIYSKLYFPRVRRHTKQKVALTAEQVNRHLSAVKDFPLFHVVLLMYETGIRVGEALALTWDDVEILNDHEGYISINKTLTKSLKGARVIGTPKTPSSNRRVYFYSSQLVSSLRNAKEKFYHWVAQGNRGVSHIHYVTFVKKYFTDIKESIGIPEDIAFSPHITRRTYVSHSLHRGITSKDIEQQVGHSNGYSIMVSYSKAIRTVEEAYRGTKLYR